MGQRNSLWWPASNGHTEVVKVLLSANVNSDIVDHQGATPRSEAIRNGHLDIVELFDIWEKKSLNL
jgi:ankyrin repeat protein